ncbi:hypothetical protein ACSS6W_003413 [Trichoderma asperelloides]
MKRIGRLWISRVSCLRTQPSSICLVSNYQISSCKQNSSADQIFSMKICISNQAIIHCCQDGGY